MKLYNPPSINIGRTSHNEVPNLRLSESLGKVIAVQPYVGLATIKRTQKQKETQKKERRGNTNRDRRVDAALPLSASEISLTQQSKSKPSKCLDLLNSTMRGLCSWIMRDRTPALDITLIETNPEDS